MMKKNKIKSLRGDVLSLNIIGYIIIIVFSILCLYPFLLLVVGSFTAEGEIYRNGYSLFPKEYSLDAYRMLLKNPDKILNAYGLTIFVTACGTAIGVFFTAMTAFVLSRKDFKHADKFSFFFYFTTLFSGGLIPYYIVVSRYLHMKNTIWVLIIPGALQVFNILIMRNFCKSIPDALGESAKIDGASNFKIFTKIYLPLMGPSIATIGLFIALAYWNNWANAMLYIDRQELYPLQYLLYRMTSNAEFASSMASGGAGDMPDMPKETVKLAMTVLSIGPVVLFYPFIQRYFVKGITVGSVKG